MWVLNLSQTSSRIRKKKLDEVERNGVIKQRYIRKQKDRKVNDGQLASKHGDKSHKNGCNDEYGKDLEILKKGRSHLSQKSNGRLILSPKIYTKIEYHK